MNEETIISPNKRNPLDKESFLEGNRQRWAAIFLGCGGAVLAVNIFVGMGFDPVPYMQFLLAIGSLFILGSSGDSWVKAYSVKSIRETEAKEETKRTVAVIKDDSKPDTNIIMEYTALHASDPSYAPQGWVNEQ